MNRVKMCLFISVCVIVAFCTSTLSRTIDSIEDPDLHRYASLEIARGAPMLAVPSRVLYREALELIEGGRWREARERLLLASELAADYPDPLFTLARIELIHGDPDFPFHLVTGCTRASRSFYHQSLIAANASLLIAAAMVGTLFVVLVALAIKHWPLIDHWLRERYAGRFSDAPTGWVSIVLLIALAFMRLGIALYIAILFVVVWSCVGRKEKALILGLTIAVAALSFLAPYGNAFIPALDPGSTTHRLALVNERGTDERLLEEIAGIDDPAYRTEREYALGTLRYRIGDYRAAKHHLLNAVSEQRDFAPAYLSLGNVYFMEGEYDQALAGYQNVVALDSTSALAYYNIGQTYIKKMLFSKSSAALERASKLGTERYQAANLSSRVMNHAIYEGGFDNGTLWALAFREGAAHPGVYLDEAMRPFLLFPFEWLWILLTASVAAAIAIGMRAPGAWNVFHCDNCGSAACDICADTETGLRLCNDCARVIGGLSSVKVMEALLRHRRQKMWMRVNRRSVTWRSMFWPGASFVYHGQSFTGVILVLISTAAFLVLVWHGFYFKDYRSFTISGPLWKTVAPIAVLSTGFLLSLKAKNSQKPRNYRILPPEMWIETKERENAPAEPANDDPPEPVKPPPVPDEAAQPMGSLIDL
jgi:tetratricopeptide (TPR) repeat protein